MWKSCGKKKLFVNCKFEFNVSLKILFNSKIGTHYSNYYNLQLKIGLIFISNFIL